MEATYFLTTEQMNDLAEKFRMFAEAVKKAWDALVKMVKSVVRFIADLTLKIALRFAPPKIRHLALYAKRARVRKKNRAKAFVFLRRILAMAEKPKEPCKSCHKAYWIDMYGKLIYGCDMTHCIAGDDDINTL